MRKTGIGPFVMALMVFGTGIWGAEGAVGERRLLEPVLDTPLRAPSICRGPDGTYYLTGTSSKDDLGEDFRNNRGVRLWRSEDLANWEDMGWVFDLPEAGGIGYRWYGMFRNHHAPADVPGARRNLRGLTSPEIHYLKGTFWIAFSRNGYGTALLKSASGRAEGPYELHAYVTSLGDHPSIFQDTDGKVYWLWSPSWIAEMKEDMTGLAGPPRLLECAPRSPMGDDVLLGDRNPFLFKADGAYYLTMADARERLGINTYDTMVGRSEELFGPYSEREIMVPHGGPTTVFQDDRGTWRATFCGRDYYAAFRDRPGIVPLTWVSSRDRKGHNANLYSPTPLPRWRKEVYTVRGPWWRLRPLISEEGLHIRDMNMTQAPDGCFYFTGSVHGERYKGRLVIFKSRDLQNWEEIEVYRFEDVEQVSPERRAYRSDALGDWCNYFMDTEIHYIEKEETFFIYAGVYGAKGVAEPGGCTLLLRSTSGKAEGPYEYWGRGPSQASFCQTDDGTVYATMGGTAIYRMNPDMRGWETVTRYAVPPGGGGLCEDAGADLIRIKDRWVLFTTGISGGHWCNNPAGGTSLLSYDFHYLTAESPEGPWSLGATPGVPFGGHGGVFRGLDGHYYAVVWGDDFYAPFHAKPGLVRLKTEMVGGRLRIDVDEDWTPADYRPPRGSR